MVGFPSHERVGVADHDRRHVRVQVERDDDGHVGTDETAHGLYKVALWVGCAFGDGRSVQRKQHAVDGQRILQPVEQFAAQVGVAVGGDVAARAGAGIDQRHDLGIGRSQDLERAANHPGFGGQTSPP